MKISKEAKHTRTNQQKDIKSKKDQIPIWPMYLLLMVFVGVYILFRSTGPLLIITIIIIILLEIVNVLRGDFRKKGIFEILAAVAVVAIIWIGLVISLGTYAPLDVVPSCSMLPTLQVGDLIIIQNSGIHSIHATTINISKKEMNAFINNISHNQYECLAYNPNNLSQVSEYVLSGYKIGLYKYTSSISRYSLVNNQSGNLIHFNCGITQIKYRNGTRRYVAYTKSLIINHTTITENKNNSIIVYKTVPSDLFYKEGDRLIVHRAYVILNASGNFYVLTKGDNNPGLDIQYANIPPNITHIEGRVLFSIPYLGYIKIALNGIPHGLGCNKTYVTTV